MGLLFVLAAILGLLFPPFAVVILAMTILGVFAKGVAADSQEQVISARRKSRQHNAGKRPQNVILRHAMAPRPGEVIDVQLDPTLPPLRLQTPMPKSPLTSDL